MAQGLVTGVITDKRASCIYPVHDDRTSHILPLALAFSIPNPTASPFLGCNSGIITTLFVCSEIRLSLDGRGNWSRTAVEQVY